MNDKTFVLAVMTCYVLCGSVFAAEAPNKGYDKYGRPATSTSANTSATSVAGVTDSRKLAGYVQTSPKPIANATVDVQPPTGIIAPENQRPLNDRCGDPAFHCVVPHRSLILATCEFGRGEQDCRDVYRQCIAVEFYRAHPEMCTTSLTAALAVACAGFSNSADVDRYDQQYCEDHSG